MLILTDNAIDNRTFPCIIYRLQILYIKELYNSLDPGGNSYCIDMEC